jgi:hypothetical protein
LKNELFDTHYFKNSEYKFLIKIMLLITLVLIWALANADVTPNISNAFDWTAGGSYSGYGKFQTKFPFPLNTPTIEVDGSLFVDTVRHVVSIQTLSQASQWVNDDGFYTLLPNGVCLYEAGFNYTRYVGDYTELLNTDLVKVCSGNLLPDFCVVYRNFGGLVRDPGACGTYASASTKTDRNNRIVTYNIDQIVYLAQYNTVTKYAGTFHVNRTVPGQPLLSDVQLPTACTLSALGSYCALFLPDGQNYVLSR